MAGGSPRRVSSRSTGRSAEQRSIASGQRGWNAQPRGTSMALGISPASCGATRRAGSGSGAAASSARVYGWAGAANSSAVGAISMIRPRYITATRSASVDDRQVVGDEDHGQAVLVAQRGEEVEDLRLDGDVERRNRLVGDEQTRPRRQCCGDADALTLTARQRVRSPVGEGRADSDLGEHLRNSGVTLLTRTDAQRVECLADAASHCPSWVQRTERVLEDRLH